MLDAQLSEIQFQLLLTALAAACAGYALRAWLVAWLMRRRQRRLRHFQPHAYRPPTLDLKTSARKSKP
ncbi:hypothetical protein DK842_20285 [Chromobacterium phragmitis]|uniref:Cellulose biosynthesis protein BcsF n=1 Tax=Chromobacterium phragmitis TaxID=2202141 RepID=A0ABV0INV3_9NEIS|nr:hypothetical protein [Chromobacterium phragmitis]AXE32029.1 hypothetical protein DK842_20285 [Chromobacterium phragmitis]